MKFSKMSEDVIKLLYVLFLIGINVCVLFFAQSTKYAYKRKFLLNNVTLLVIGFILLIGGGILCASILRKITIHLNYCVLAGTALLFISQIYICKNIYFETAWDARVMVTAARQMGNGIYQGEFDTYFSYYPNNLFLTTLISFACKAITCFGDVTRQQYFFPMIVIQCMISCITGALIYKSVQMLINEKWAMAAWIFYVALLGFNPWLVIVYSDSMSLFFSIACFYLYLKSYGGWREVIKWAFMAGLASIGYLIKPQNVIVLIACVVITLLRIGREKKERFLQIICISAGIFLFAGVQLLGTQISMKSSIQINKDIKMPMIHWAMMGLNPEGHGAYNKDDVLYTQSFESTDEMKKADWEVIKGRMKAYGVRGMADHLKKKTLINYADGAFAWRCEGNFFHTLFPDINSKVSGKLKDLFYYGKSWPGKLRETFVQGVWLQVLFWMAAAVAFKEEKEKDAVNVALLTVIGTILFATIFEARARYLMCNASIYIVLAILGMRTVYQRLGILDRE